MECCKDEGGPLSKLVTLLRCPVILPLGSVAAQQGVPSLALAYLSAALKNHNYKTFCIDALGEGIDNYKRIENSSLILNGLTSKEIIQLIPKDSEFIAISCMFSNEWIYTKKIINEINRERPDLKIILGGEHASADYESILREVPFIQACILGEGEEAIVEVVKTLDENQSLSNVSGLATITDNIVKLTNKRNRIKTINSITWPDWEGTPLRMYLDRGLGMAAQGIRAMPMLTSRGCPYRCTFCSSENMWTTSWYPRDVLDVIKEMKSYIKTYEVTHFEFYDLTAIVNKKWTQDFCRALITEELNITWSLPSGTRSEALCPETLKLLKESGCLKLTYAPESGSDRLLKVIQKRANLNKMLTSMRNCAKLGIIVKANIIFGFPGTLRSDLFKDFYYLFKMALYGVHDVTCFAFVPYPGSKIYSDLVNSGKIVKDESYHEFLSYNVYNDVTKMKSWTSVLKNWQLPMITLGGMSFFYSIQFLTRPWRFLHSIYRILIGKPITMFELAIDNMLNGFLKGKKIEVRIESIKTSKNENIDYFSKAKASSGNKEEKSSPLT